VTTVRSQNDLKPTISTFLNLSKLSPFVVNVYFAVSCSTPQEHTTSSRGSHGAGLFRREERRLSFPRREGSSRDASVRNRQKENTFGRFSFRGPAAWRLDGGTGEKRSMAIRPL